ncbi:hypothetical protein TNCV_3796181 [Trichonephila clavipes]|nr:hypothetical protein TNCV_3796181 [Trichonephila clavipes]
MSNFSMQELLSALNALDPNKSPGPENIHGVRITHLGPIDFQRLLDIFNPSWKRGRQPHECKKGTVIPIKKPDKLRSILMAVRKRQTQLTTDSRVLIELHRCIIKIQRRKDDHASVFRVEQIAIISAPFPSITATFSCGNEVADELAKASPSDPVDPEDHMVLKSSEIYSRAK